MKSLVVLAALFAAAVAVSVSKKAPLLNADSPTCIEDEYIVVFEDEIADELVQQHFSLLNNLIALDGKSTNRVLHQYHIGSSFRGYSAHIDKSILDQVRDMKEVKYVERNMEVKAFQERCNEQLIYDQGLWGLVRTVNRNITTNDIYYYTDGDGEEVNVYILDTGIYTEHNDFNGRAVFGADFVGEGPGDGNGHGTHCAGTVMSETYGLAKKATAIAVKVLSRFGSGSFEGVIAGINWVAGQHSQGKMSVASMSLGGGRHTATNAAVEAAVGLGVHFSIAAGNEDQDGCNVSPGSSEGAMGVAASDSTDDLAYFSNYGTCTEIIAPGVNVLSTWNSQDSTNTISGTSMAAPHVAGVMAKILSVRDYSPAELVREIKEMASKNKITINGSRRFFDHNDLVYYKSC